MSSSRTSSNTSSFGSSRSSGSSPRVNIIFPEGQQHFASLLRLYLERRGAAVTLMGEAGGRCSRQLVLLPASESQREGLATWLAELARTASRRSSNMVAVVEERGQWRKTDPWLQKLPVLKSSVLWVHDYQEACVQRIAEMLRLDEDLTEEEDEAITEEEDITEEEEEVEDITQEMTYFEESKSQMRGGQELWGTIRNTFMRKRTISEDSGYCSS